MKKARKVQKCSRCGKIIYRDQIYFIVRNKIICEKCKNSDSSIQTKLF